MTRRSIAAVIATFVLTACGQRSESAAPAKPTSAAPAPCAPIAQARATSAPAAPAPTALSTPSSTTTLSSTASSDAKGDEDVSLRLKRLVLARGVENREPVSPASSFTKGDLKRVYAFIEIENPDKKETEILVSFAKQGAPESGAVHLKVGASRRWRTWATSTAVQKPGKWRVVVRNAAGKELGQSAFEILDAAAPNDAKPAAKAADAKPGA